MIRARGALSLFLLAVLSTALTYPVRGVAEPSSQSQPEIAFVGPSVRELPTELEFLSPSPSLTGGFSCLTVTTAQPCQAYLAAYEGPDTSGLYHYRFDLPTAAPGEVRFEAQAPDGARLPVTFTALDGGIFFGDVKTCLMPGTGAEGHQAFELAFYSQSSSTAVVFSQERIGHRWDRPRLKALANYPVGGPNGLQPYTRRTLRLRLPAMSRAGEEVRMRYFVIRGDHPRLDPGQRMRALRASRPFSTSACLPPGGI